VEWRECPVGEAENRKVSSGPKPWHEVFQPALKEGYKKGQMVSISISVSERARHSDRGGPFRQIN
jgi:hypothetical protein